MFREKILDAVAQDNKVAKKLMKPWQAVVNALAQHEAEQKAAAAASKRLGALRDRKRDREESSCPLPPSMTSFTMQIGNSTFGFTPLEPANHSPPPNVIHA